MKSIINFLARLRLMEEVYLFIHFTPTLTGQIRREQSIRGCREKRGEEKSKGRKRRRGARSQMKRMSERKREAPKSDVTKAEASEWPVDSSLITAKRKKEREEKREERQSEWSHWFFLSALFFLFMSPAMLSCFVPVPVGVLQVECHTALGHRPRDRFTFRRH